MMRPASRVSLVLLAALHVPCAVHASEAKTGCEPPGGKGAAGVKDARANCRGPKAVGDLEKHENSTAEESDALMRRTQQQTLELLKSLKKN